MSEIHQPTRRQFLRRGALALSAAAPLFVPRRVLGFAGVPGANEQINIAVIGVGIRGKQLIRNVKNTNRGRIVALCDVHAGRIAETQQEHHANWKVFEDYRRMLDHPKGLDGVMICTPHHQHVLPAMLACQAGLDVFVEKPLSNYVREGRALVKAARRYNRVVQVGSQQRTMEMNRFACEFVRGGGIGEVTLIEAVSFGGAIPYPKNGLPEEPIPAGLNWDLFQGPAPYRPFNRELARAKDSEEPGRRWFTWRDYSGGANTDMIAHSLDMVQYALGTDDSGPVDFWPVSGQGTDARVDFRYANGLEVHCKFPARWSPPYRGPNLGAIFTGEKCKIEINRNKFTTNPPDFVTNPPDPELAKKWEGEGWVALGHIENWFDCIKSRAKPNADVEIGHRTVTIGHLISITREVGRNLRWDPVAEQIVGDDEANALLDRPHRKGWELPAV